MLVDNTLTQAYATPAPVRPDPCADPAPPCPACGGLKCLCRPRFFPGQLLSDDDLNRLQQYVIDKNRLHNRYLVGWGVACGLEVVCSPCDAGQVTVRAGYALSPCGDDIVVCGDQAVDVCALIQACRPTTTTCDTPYGTQTPASCTQGTERWVLAVCYDERPTRPINALSAATDSVANAGCRCGGGSSGCSCGRSTSRSACACGSGSSGNCGCGAKSSAYQPASQRRKVLPQCEPTQICEGFRFTAYKAPVPTKGLAALGNANNTNTMGSDLMIAWLYANRARFGPLLERTLCCVLQAMELRASLAEGRTVDAAGAASAYRDYAQGLNEFAGVFSLHHCSFVSVIGKQYESATGWAASRMGGTLSVADQAELTTRLGALDESWMQIVTECFCSALLPACPPSSTSNCVPLAVVTVNTGSSYSTANRVGGASPCQVIDICNWQERKLLITWPTILYWLSWIPWQRLRDAIATICCGSGVRGTAYTAMMMMLGVAVSGAKRSSASTSASGAGLVAQKMAATSAGKAAAAASNVDGQPAAGSFEAAMQAPNLLLHMLSDYDDARAGAASQPEWAALLARAVDGSAFAPLAGSLAVQKIDLSDLGNRLGVDAMREQMAALQQTVARQDGILRALQIVNGAGQAPTATG